MFLDVEEEPVHQFPCPVLESLLTSSEIQELLSLIDQPESPSSGSQDSNRAVYSSDERKRRRMESNRQSARRSRWRKKRHLENLNREASRFMIENRQLKNRLSMTMHQNRVVSLENERLRSECVALMARLSDLCWILGCNNYHH